uniref:Uncharacterized protein n=1 Tax=Lygus hesperus TaxID=30085 RepID=A0A146LNC8_LYGHE
MTMPANAPNGQSVAPLHKVEQCSNAIPYVLMLPHMLPIAYPPLSSATRVKVPANHDFEAVANIKLMQDALHRNGVTRPEVLMSETSKIMKGNFQANLQLLQ